jgi:hypothetical protein
LNQRNFYYLHTNLYQFENQLVIYTIILGKEIGDDVIVIDRCGAELDAEHSVIEVKMYVTNQLTPGTKILQYDDGHEYRVCLILIG